MFKYTYSHLKLAPSYLLLNIQNQIPEKMSFIPAASTSYRAHQFNIRNSWSLISKCVKPTNISYLFPFSAVP